MRIRGLNNGGAPMTPEAAMVIAQQAAYTGPVLIGWSVAGSPTWEVKGTRNASNPQCLAALTQATKWWHQNQKGRAPSRIGYVGGRIEVPDRLR